MAIIDFDFIFCFIEEATCSKQNDLIVMDTFLLKRGEVSCIVLYGLAFILPCCLQQPHSHESSTGLLLAHYSAATWASTGPLSGHQ